MPGPARLRLSALACLCVLVAASCSGGDDSTTAAAPQAQPPPRRTIDPAAGRAELVRLLDEAGVEVGPVAAGERDTLAGAWRAFRRFAALDAEDPFLADPVAEGGDELLFRAGRADSERYGLTQEVAFVRRFRFESFTGEFDRQQQVRLSLHYDAAGELAVVQPELSSLDRAGAGRREQAAAWEQAVDESEALRTALSSGARPVAVEVVVEEGDIH